MNRRTFVKNSSLTAFSIGAFGVINWNGKSFEGDTPTTTDILGPFYRPGAPMRANLIPAGTTGKPLILSGTIFQKNGKTPMANALIETWQCDEHEHYDNTSDDYVLRGAVKTGADGKYEFKTIVPVPYMAGRHWRPAHIHLRISSADHQDLITQIYFTGDPHMQEDESSRAPGAIKRILTLSKNAAQENTVKFDIVMAKEFPLDAAAFKKLEGIYEMKDKNLIEFTKVDDLFFAKRNGQFDEAFYYKGNNEFEAGGPDAMKVRFELLSDGVVNVKATFPGPNNTLVTAEGTKILKY